MNSGRTRLVWHEDHQSVHGTAISPCDFGLALEAQTKKLEYRSVADKHCNQYQHKKEHTNHRDDFLAKVRLISIVVIPAHRLQAVTRFFVSHAALKSKGALEPFLSRQKYQKEGYWDIDSSHKRHGARRVGSKREPVHRLPPEWATST